MQAAIVQVDTPSSVLGRPRTGLPEKREPLLLGRVAEDDVLVTGMIGLFRELAGPEPPPVAVRIFQAEFRGVAVLPPDGDSRGEDDPVTGRVGGFPLPVRLAPVREDRVRVSGVTFPDGAQRHYPAGGMEKPDRFCVTRRKSEETTGRAVIGHEEPGPFLSVRAVVPSKGDDSNATLPRREDVTARGIRSCYLRVCGTQHRVDHPGLAIRAGELTAVEERRTHRYR